jgi:hypothetical protein
MLDGLLNPNQLIVFLGRDEHRQNDGVRSTQQAEKFIRGNVTGKEKAMGPFRDPLLDFPEIAQGNHTLIGTLYMNTITQPVIVSVPGIGILTLPDRGMIPTGAVKLYSNAIPYEFFY